MKTFVISAVLLSGIAWSNSPAVAENPKFDNGQGQEATALHATDSTETSESEDLDEQLRKRLTSEQAYRLLREKEQNRTSTPAVAMVIPLGAFLLAFAIVAIALYSGLRKDKQRHETLRLMIEKGAAIPPELLVTPQRTNADFRGGLGLVSIGAGIMIMLATMPGTSAYWTGGLVPFALGLARLVYWAFERSQNRASNVAH